MASNMASDLARGILERKLRIGLLNPISQEWFHLHSDKIELCQNIAECDYIIYESNGDPCQMIMKIKTRYPNNKLVFILSGDQSAHIDDSCIWFSNAVKPSGLALKQTQIFVSNPAIFKFYDSYKAAIAAGGIELGNRDIDVYFKGTIWAGMRVGMYNYFTDKEINSSGMGENNPIRIKMIANNNYWGWRLNGIRKPTQSELESVAYESYREMINAKLVLCPKGNGNSSMRILEALGCGAIPILIDDFSAPFGNSWEGVGLVFNSQIQSWEYIYNECRKLLMDHAKMAEMQEKGQKYFKDVIYGDSLINPAKWNTYKDINTVCYGFSNLIINKLIEFHK